MEIQTPLLPVKHLSEEEIAKIGEKQVSESKLKDLFPLYGHLAADLDDEMKARAVLGDAEYERIVGAVSEKIEKKWEAERKERELEANQKILTGDPVQIRQGVKIHLFDNTVKAFQAANKKNEANLEEAWKNEQELLKRLGVYETPLGKYFTHCGITPKMIDEIRGEKATTAGSTPGSYYVPSPLLSDVIDYFWEENLLFPLCTHINVDTPTGSLPRSKLTSGAPITNFARTSEGSAGTEGAIAADTISWSCEDVKGFITVSDTFMTSNIVASAQWIFLQLRRSMDLFLKNWMINGTGTNQFYGMYTEASTYGTMIHASNLALDDFLDAQDTMGGDVELSERAVFVGKKGVKFIVLKRKDANGQYYYSPTTPFNEITGVDFVNNLKVADGVCLLILPASYLIFNNLALAKMIRETGGYELQTKNKELFGMRLHMDGKFETNTLDADDQAVVGIDGIA